MLAHLTFSLTTSRKIENEFSSLFMPKEHLWLGVLDQTSSYPTIVHQHYTTPCHKKIWSGYKETRKEEIFSNKKNIKKK
jgi:hypothetical protein